MKGNVRIFAYDVNSKIQNSPKVSLEHGFCVRRGDVLLLTILCIIEVRFFVSIAVLKSPPERKAEKRYG